MLTAEDKSFIIRALAMHAMLTRSAFGVCSDYDLEEMIDLIDVVANRRAAHQTDGETPTPSAQLQQASSETT